jgi:hypothetical protein
VVIYYTGCNPTPSQWLIGGGTREFVHVRQGVHSLNCKLMLWGGGGGGGGDCDNSGTRQCYTRHFSLYLATEFLTWSDVVSKMY